MSLFSSARGAEGKSVVAVFDIGSGSIGAALVSLSRTHLPNIVWTKRTPITFQQTVEYEKLSKTMLSTLLDIALELQSEGVPLLKQIDGPNRITDVMFAFASPWYSMQAKVFRVEKEEEFEITEQFIKNLIKKEEMDFRKGSSVGKNSEETVAPVLIERQIIQTALNGYIVSNPYKKPVKKAQIDLVLSAVPSYIYEKAADIKTQLIHRKSGGIFNSFILPAFIVTRDVFHNNTSFLFLDVSAEVTDVVTVNKGTIIDATSFPYGKHTVIREVAAKLGSVPEEAASMLAGYLEGDSSSVQAEQIKNILENVQKAWLRHFTETLEKISREAPLPKNVFVTVDDDYGELFSRIIAAGDFTSFALSKAPFKVTILGAEVLSKYCTYSKLTAELDPFLAIEALFLQKLLYEQDDF